MKRFCGYILLFVLMMSLAGCFLSVSVEKTGEPVETLEATLPVETTVPVTVPEETEPVTEPIETEPAETVPEETEPAVTEPEETQPKETQPKPTDPKPTEPPKETQPKPTDPPKETQPKETQPKPTDPKPTEPPKETQPKPTDPPKETQPKPTEPPKETQPKPTEPPATTAPKDEHPPCDGDWEHAFIESTIRPTCTEQGYTRYFCVSCFYEYKTKFVPALGGSHSYEVNKVVEPTGMLYGYTLYKCNKCGHEYEADFVDPLPAEEIDVAALEEYGRQYAASLGYTPSTVPGFDNNAGYFPPMYRTIKTMEDGRRAARSAVDYQYTNDCNAGYATTGRINVRFIPTGEPDCYLVYCFYGGE